MPQIPYYQKKVRPSPTSKKVPKKYTGIEAEKHAVEADIYGYKAGQKGYEIQKVQYQTGQIQRMFSFLQTGAEFGQKIYNHQANIEFEDNRLDGKAFFENIKREYSNDFDYSTIGQRLQEDLSNYRQGILKNIKNERAKKLYSNWFNEKQIDVVDTIIDKSYKNAFEQMRMDNNRILTNIAEAGDIEGLQEQYNKLEYYWENDIEERTFAPAEWENIKKEGLHTAARNKLSAMIQNWKYETAMDYLEGDSDFIKEGLSPEQKKIRNQLMGFLTEQDIADLKQEAYDVYNQRRKYNEQQHELRREKQRKDALFAGLENNMTPMQFTRAVQKGEYTDTKGELHQINWDDLEEPDIRAIREELEQNMKDTRSSRKDNEEFKDEFLNALYYYSDNPDTEKPYTDKELKDMLFAKQTKLKPSTRDRYYKMIDDREVVAFGLKDDFSQMNEYVDDISKDLTDPQQIDNVRTIVNTAQDDLTKWLIDNKDAKQNKINQMKDYYLGKAYQRLSSQAFKKHGLLSREKVEIEQYEQFSEDLKTGNVDVTKESGRINRMGEAMRSRFDNIIRTEENVYRIGLPRFLSKKNCWVIRDSENNYWTWVGGRWYRQTKKGGPFEQYSGIFKKSLEERY